MNKRVTLDAVNVLRASEETIPEPPEDGAVVKVTFAGVCHSDVHITRRLYHPKFEFPRVLGHEISGTVYSLGTRAAQGRTDLQVGDNVCVYPWGMCQDCPYCRADVTYCSTMHYGRGPVRSYVYGIWRDGGYQQYVTIDLVKFLEKVPDGLSMEAAATLTCGGVTSYNAVTSLEESINTAKRVNGSALVAVIGAGALALWAIQIIKAFHPTGVSVVAIDINDDKLGDAKAAGADMLHKWGIKECGQEAADALVAASGRPDGIIDFTGIASVIERAHLALNIGGTLTLVGLAGTDLPTMTLNSILRRNVSIKGIIVGSQPQCRELIKLVVQGKVRPPPFTHITLEELSATLDKLHDGTQRGRAVIKM